MQNLELDEKIKEWAASNPKYSRFLKVGNMPLLRQCYKKDHRAEKVSECVEGGKALLALLITDEEARQPLQLCNQCGRKRCSETEGCGEMDFVERQPRSYQASDLRYKGMVDAEGNIKVNYAPFDDKMTPLEVGKMYLIDGVISSYKGIFDIRPKKVDDITDSFEKYIDSNEEPTTEALDEKKEINFDEAWDVVMAVLDMGNGSFDPKQWDRQLLKPYKPIKAKLMKRLEKRKDGRLCLKNA